MNGYRKLYGMGTKKAVTYMETIKLNPNLQDTTKKWRKIGFGTYPLAGSKNGAVSYGEVEKEEAIYSLKCAYDWGINFFDTSDFYGYGYVEELIGEAFGDKEMGYREDIVIATKGGMVDNDGKQNFDSNYLFNSLLGSLQRLDMNYVDLYMLHSPKLENIEKYDLMPFLKLLVEDGWIKKFGISLRNPEDGIEAITKYGFRAIEVNYNLLDRRAEFNGLFDLCKEKGVKTIIRTPLGQGILSGEFRYNEDKADKRNELPYSKVENQQRIVGMMLRVMDPNNYSAAQNCLRFCLSNDAVTTVIPGMKNSTEVITNAAVPSLPPLTKEELQKIDTIYQEEKLLH
jgi:aryl-alcohol dehydrogenase-like predicted oxidoreductase